MESEDGVRIDPPEEVPDGIAILGNAENPTQGGLIRDLFERVFNLGVNDELWEDEEEDDGSEDAPVQGERKEPYGDKIRRVLWLFLMLYVTLMTLSFFRLWDPCSWVAIPLSRSCSTHSILRRKFFTYTELKEEYFCLLPGTTFTKELKGWNLDISC